MQIYLCASRAITTGLKRHAKGLSAHVAANHTIASKAATPKTAVGPLMDVNHVQKTAFDPMDDAKPPQKADIDSLCDANQPPTAPPVNNPAAWLVL
jgi:hypothetical protein